MNQLSHKYGTYEKQTELLAMMKDIDALFGLNGIQYSLAGGSILGAVRENGFIPWDDDIDIMVDRKNYEKIIDVFNLHSKDTNYTLNRYLWLERIQRKDDTRKGLYASTIDIFIVDNCPDNVFVRYVKLILIMMLQGMMKVVHDYTGQSLFYRLCLSATRILGKLASDETKYRWYQKVSQIGNRKNSAFVSCYGDLFRYLSLRYPNTMLSVLTKHQFEDTEFYITEEYDRYLSIMFGDYMTPPEEKERRPIHTM